MKNGLCLLLIFFMLHPLLNCRNKVFNVKMANEEAIALLPNDTNDKCDIPDEIRSFVASSKEFELLTEKDLKLIRKFVDSSICPTYTKGDFNFNGKEDIAIVVRYKGYKNEEYASYIFPFLLIFNDYKDGIEPIIVYKTGDYANEDIKTVIYDQFEEGIFSYLKKGNVCDKEVIDIIIPEKSSFFVFWNPIKLSYEVLNYLDEDLCQKLAFNQDSSKGNLSLSKNFSFSFFVSNIENSSDKQKIKIVLINEKTNEIQKIDFIPESLSGDFNENPSNYSYFSIEKQTIETSEGIENYHKLIILDVNFDGLEDFAIINYEGGNGGPQYAYYIQKSNKQFALDMNLTNNVRYFPIEINKIEKSLTIGHPSGCCKIRTYKIQIQSNGEWKEIYSKLEDIK